MPSPAVGRSHGRLTLRLFGPLEIEDGVRTLGPRDLGGARPKQVLEILVAARGRLVPTERIAELLWGAQRPEGFAASIQTFVSVLRRHLVTDRARARELVVTETGAYRFATERVDLDLDRFDELLERSSREPTRAARRSLAKALAIARGEALEDEPYAGWAQDLRGSYRGRVLGAHLDAADHALAELDFADALAHSETAASLDPFSERAQRTSILALYAMGRQHDALARYRCYRAVLDRELGLEPTGETRALELAILRQEDVLSLVPRPIVRSEPSEAEPSLRLLGRGAELDTLSRAIARALEGHVGLLHVEAETGLGKTRLLDELESTLDGVRVGRATCSKLEQHLPYVPLATAIRDALAGEEIDGERLSPLGQVLPELALGAPKTEHEEIEVLEALVALVAERAPLVLLLDDLQWADARTLAALGYLQRRGGGCAAAIVTAARPSNASHDPLRELQPDARVALEPLTPADLAPLGIPDLHETTGGNPRFVAETVACGEHSAPSRSLAEALVAQCRAEGEWGCRVLSAAAVLEQPFAPEPLAELLRTDEGALIEELERLCERRILRVDGLRFRFRYDLVRQVLLDSVSPARRRLLRRRLEERAGETELPPERVLGSAAG